MDLIHQILIFHLYFYQYFVLDLLLFMKVDWLRLVYNKHHIFHIYFYNLYNYLGAHGRVAYGYVEKTDMLVMHKEVLHMYVVHMDYLGMHILIYTYTS